METAALVPFARRWAEAALLASPPAVDVFSEQQGCDGVLRHGRSLTGQPLCVAGRTFARGLATHAESRVRVVCSGPARRWRSLIGVDENPTTRAPYASHPRLVFAIEVAGRPLWTSPPVRLGDPPKPVDVDLGGADTFHLVVRSLGDERTSHPAPWYGHGDWLDPEVELQDGTRYLLGDLEARRLPRRTVFAFSYGGQPLADLLPAWTVCRQSDKRLPDGWQHTVVYSDRVTGLVVTLELRSFDDFPAVEWLLHLRNTGLSDTPIIEDLCPLDYAWDAGGDIVLHRAKGSDARVDDFFYFREELLRGRSVSLAPAGGRSSSGSALAFFNVEAAGGGMVVGIGWSGQWRAEISRNQEDVVRLRAGQERVHLRLHPGESIRTPRIALLFWDGEPLVGHNWWRRFVLAHHTPQRHGRPVESPISAAMWGGMKLESHLERIRMIREQRLPYDVYWVDAGWYGPPEAYAPEADEYDLTWPRYVGDWRINPAIYPQGLKPLSDAVHAAGMRFLLWVDSERAVDGTPVAQQHPEWFLPAPPGAHVWPQDIRPLLLNLGHPEARAWLVETVDRLIREHGVDVYRHDFNTDPLDYWRSYDTPDRQGMTEIRHIEGLYAFLDELRRRHPDLLIDNCASGGRRLDLEMLSRTLPLWRTDYTVPPTFDPIGNQVHTMGLAYWVPLSGTGVQVRPNDTYNFRSGLSAGLVFQLFWFERTPVSPDYPYDWHRRMMADYRRARPFFYGDYHPLLPLSTAQNVWAACQFHRPDWDAGLLLVFRREASPFVTADLKLHGLRPDGRYVFEDADTGPAGEHEGHVLLEQGWRVTLDQPRTSRLVFYKAASDDGGT